jgi:hypothetical protein
MGGGTTTQHDVGRMVGSHYRYRCHYGCVYDPDNMVEAGVKDDADDGYDLMHTLAHFLLWAPGSYLSPQEMAEGLLRRLDHDGYEIVRCRRER